jgi:hypothetical protein
MLAMCRTFLAALLLCPLVTQGQPAAPASGARAARGIDRQSFGEREVKVVPPEQRTTVIRERPIVRDRVLTPGCPTCAAIIDQHGTTGAEPIVRAGASIGGATAPRPPALCRKQKNYFNTVTGECLSKMEIGLRGTATSSVPSTTKLPALCRSKMYYNTLTEKCLSKEEVAGE